MGMIDLPAPLFSGLDGLLGQILPPIVRVLLWAGLGAVLSMELYRVLSPQAKIAQLKAEFQRAQQQVSDYDGDFDGAWPLIGRMLSLAFRRILTVLPSTLIACLPLLALIVWLDSAYGYTFPPNGQAPTVEVEAPFKGEWREPAQGDAPRAVVLDDGDRVVIDTTLAAAIPILHKRHWWNILIGNPAGYLQEDAPIETIAIDLPRLEVLPAGPTWLRGWEASFFVALIILSVILKWARRIE